MRSIWTGTVSFGLVNIPVRLYVASEERGLDLDMLHKKDLSPVRYVRVCKADGREVPYEEIVKGYQYRKGDYVVLTEDELKKASVQKTYSVDIVRFVDETEIDTIYFEKPYYLEPDKGAEKAYALLREALRRAKKVGVARFVLRNREHLGVVKPEGRVIVLNTLRYKAAIRDAEDLKLPASEAAKGKELDMALQLIDQLTEPFKPEEFKDTYVEDLKRLIDEKVKGRPLTAAGEAPAPTAVPDLMAALKASLKGRGSNRAHSGPAGRGRKTKEKEKTAAEG
jgi:DNA end-binding protein Ku